MITLSQIHSEEIKSHGREAFPEECCGAMLGVVDTEGGKITKKIVRIENTMSENRHRRFSITPDDYRQLESLAKSENLTLLGFYHTHPDHPAQPSQTDLSFAWPFFSYIILSVLKGNPDIMNSFELDLDTEKFKDESIAIRE
ncbi:MAG TPA: M67 family metallopeptidase [Leptospiraceae bacterium]|nr:M67 family metallopeptidase [Leptospiraceae bacterium]